MDFNQKYVLIEPLAGEGPKSFRARQISLKREVTVHLLVDGHTAENEALLARLRMLPPDSLYQIIEVGDDENARYIVTAAPPFQHLLDWLRDQEHAAAEAERLAHRGVWKVAHGEASNPAPPNQPAARAGEFDDMFGPPHLEPISPGTPQPSASLGSSPTVPPAELQPGEFTRLFQSAAQPDPTMPGSPPAESQPGEFTRLFQSAAQPVPTRQYPAAPDTTPPASPRVAPAPSSLSVESEPGEFTRLFQAAAQPAPTRQYPAPPETTSPALPRVAPAPSSVPDESQPGEFTRLFQAAAQPAPTRQYPAAPAPTPSSLPAEPQPGEFTRLFQSPANPTPTMQHPAPPAPEPVSPVTSETPGEFTLMFNSPMPAPQSAREDPPLQPFPGEGSEFSRMLQSPPANPVTESDPKGSEFSRFYQNPPGKPGPSLPAAPGFPFGSGSPGGPSPSQRYGPPDGVTKAFSTPSPAQSYTPKAEPGPSEFTRVISRGPLPNVSAPSISPPSGQPDLPKMHPENMLSMPAIPQVRIPEPQMPQYAMPQPAAPKLSLPQPVEAPTAPFTNILLLVIGGLVMFLLGGLVVYLLMRR